MRVYSFYYLKWRHLVNRLLLDNATLKLQHYGVGRCLFVHRKDKRTYVCGTGGQGQQSILLIRRFWLRVTLHPCITSGRCSKTSHTARAICNICYNAKNVIHRCRTWHCDHQTTQIRIWCTNVTMLFGERRALQEMVYHCKSLKSVQELKVQLSLRGNNCYKRSLVEISVNGGVAF